MWGVQRGAAETGVSPPAKKGKRNSEEVRKKGFYYRMKSGIKKEAETYDPDQPAGVYLSGTHCKNVLVTYSGLMTTY